MNQQLAAFGISPQTGFLPETPPLHSLPAAFAAWEEVAQRLPKYLLSDEFRRLVEDLPAFPIGELRSEAEHERAMVLLSYLGHAYVWCGPKAADRIPAVLAVPWHAVATQLGRPPMLSYASYCLHNYSRLVSSRDLEAGNVALVQSFLGGVDEEWFVVIHVDIEMKAAAALRELLPAQEAAGTGDIRRLRQSLEAIAASLDAMNTTMERMPEWCDPYIYYHRVRPYIHGWNSHPDLPEGVVYEGVEAYGGKPQRFRGETGAQSGIVPALDAFLGVEHAQDVLRDYLMEMRRYMPPGHRRFVETIEAGASVREFVEGRPELREAYDHCVAGVHRFRAKHLEYAATYIFKQAQTDSKNPHAVGTGGTPFMPYLKKHRDETEGHLLAAH
ncbi:MAG: hypothetical protein JSS65_12180 [Armatimonadetes bacterium]|nr:hypothetical protein [Armatimonadota bacterium]